MKNSALLEKKIMQFAIAALCGYRMNGDVFIVIDPNVEAPGVRELSLNNLEKAWNSKMTGTNIRAAILTGNDEQQ